MHNPSYDDLFLASHYVKGLKDEIRGVVQSQVPDTVDRASMLAKVQQQLLDKAKFKTNRPYASSRTANVAVKTDTKHPPVNSTL